MGNGLGQLPAPLLLMIMKEIPDFPTLMSFLKTARFVNDMFKECYLEILKCVSSNALHPQLRQLFFTLLSIRTGRPHTPEEIESLLATNEDAVEAELKSQIAKPNPKALPLDDNVADLNATSADPGPRCEHLDSANFFPLKTAHHSLEAALSTVKTACLIQDEAWSVLGRLLTWTNHLQVSRWLILLRIYGSLSIITRNAVCNYE